jgi:hypothetical protein
VEWTARVERDRQILWLLRVLPGGRCVLGTYGDSATGDVKSEFLEHRLAPSGKEEVVLVRFNVGGQTRWGVLVADSSNLWSGLGTNQAPWELFIADQARFREDNGRLQLVMTNRYRSDIWYFDGIHFGTRP